MLNQQIAQVHKKNLLVTHIQHVLIMFLRNTFILHLAGLGWIVISISLKEKKWVFKM